MRNNPSHFKDAGDNAPVENVSWNDCQKFLNKLCDMEGVPHGTYSLLYEVMWEYACRAGTSTAFYNGKLNEYKLNKIAWYKGNSEIIDADSNSVFKRKKPKKVGTHSIGLKSPNAWGLYDTIGNVKEWCSNETGNISTKNQVLHRFWAIRGGGWSSLLKFCHSAFRSNSDTGYYPSIIYNVSKRRFEFRIPIPVYRNNALGLRIMRKLPEGKEH